MDETLERVDNVNHRDPNSPKKLQNPESKSEPISFSSNSIRSNSDHLHHQSIANSLSFNYPNNGALTEVPNRPHSAEMIHVNEIGIKEIVHRKNDCSNDNIETITLNDDDIKIELGDDSEIETEFFKYQYFKI